MDPDAEDQIELAERFYAVCDRLRCVERRSHWLALLLAAAAVGGATAALLSRREPCRPTVETLRRNGVI